MLRKRLADIDGAIADFSEAIRLDPKDYAAFALRGNSRAAKKDYERALADYDAALQIEPGDSYAHRGRADIRIRRGDNDGAIADFDVVLAGDPNDVGAHVDRGIAFARKGDFAGAIPDLDAALKLRPDDPDTRNRRSHMNFIEGHFAEAAADFGDVVEKTPEYELGKLLRYIARARSGDNDIGELKRNTDKLDRKGWPWPMVAVYLGQMSREEMLAKMKNMRLEDDFGDCGVSFYLGQYLMVKHKPQEALPYLKQAAEVCRGDGEFERDAARAELRRQQAAR
jgi:tetratricopeptide (TPR) repeat protein